MSGRRKIRIFRIRADSIRLGVGSSQIENSGIQEVHAPPSLVFLKNLLLSYYAKEVASLRRYQPSEGGFVLQKLRDGQEPLDAGLKDRWSIGLSSIYSKNRTSDK